VVAHGEAELDVWIEGSVAAGIIKTRIGVIVQRNTWD
jgi:hypothetical protein